MKMKFTYRNSETTTIEIETADEIAITLETSYREEANGNRRYRAHTYSMDAALYEGIEYAAPDTPESTTARRWKSRSCILRSQPCKQRCRLSVHDVCRQHR